MLVFGSIYHATVVLEGRGPFSGLRRCFDLVLPHMGHATISFLLVFLIGLAFSLGAEMTTSILTLQGGGGIVTGAIQLATQVAVTMLFLAAAIVVHSDLKARTDPPEVGEELELSPV